MVLVIWLELKGLITVGLEIKGFNTMIRII